MHWTFRMRALKPESRDAFVRALQTEILEPHNTMTFRPNRYHHWIPGEFLREVGCFVSFDIACFTGFNFDIIGEDDRDHCGLWFDLSQAVVQAGVAISYCPIGLFKIMVPSLHSRLVHPDTGVPLVFN